MSRYASTPLIVALFPGHSDITRFLPWLPIATGNNSDRAKKNFKSCSDDWHHWRFWSAFRHFRTHFAESFRMSKSSWMMDQTGSREMPSCSAIDLAEIRWSSKMSSWIDQYSPGWSLFWVVQDEAHHRWKKSPRLNWATQILTVAYDGACSPNISIRIAWISSAPCNAGKETWWQLASRCSLDCARHLTCFLSASVTRKDLQVGTWTDPSFQRHYQLHPTTLGSRSG